MRPPFSPLQRQLSAKPELWEGSLHCVSTGHTWKISEKWVFLYQHSLAKQKLLRFALLRFLEGQGPGCCVHVVVGADFVPWGIQSTPKEMLPPNNLHS